MYKDTQGLTQVEFQEADFPVAKRMAKRLGYNQTAYTSSSALWGLFCLPDRATTIPHRRGGCIIKTRELGFLWVQNQEDVGIDEKPKSEYQPKTGAACSCKRGVQRDNCPACEGTGMVIDFKTIRDRRVQA